MNNQLNNGNKIKILFICLGNICRSPAAHAVMQHLVEERGCADRYMIDSAGIGNWHFTQHPSATCVPDPYYGDADDFNLALDLIEDGCEGILNTI